MKTMPILFALIFAFICSHCSEPKDAKLHSPNGKVAISLLFDSNTGSLSYTTFFEGQKTIDTSLLTLQLKDRQAALKFSSVYYGQQSTVDTTWLPIYGERKIYPDHYTQMEIECTTNDPNLSKLSVIVRAYDEGVAFKYLSRNDGSVTITKELTEFKLPSGTNVWTSKRAQGPISKMQIANLDEAVERPLLAQLHDSLFLAIGEASLVDFARMKLISRENSSSTLTVDLGSEVVFNKAFESPWRFIMAGKSAGAILENNYLLLNLNNPTRLVNTNWIKPGKVIREVTLTTQGGLACVDFAVKHDLQFVEFDAGWYGPENEEESDATTVTVDPKRSKGPLDMPKVIAYAKRKNIGILLYVNQKALQNQLDQILPLYQSWGVKGIKYGFVNVGSQEWTTWLHEAVAKAAAHELMIDIHDEYRPTGVSRTWPNLMTQEGIRGDEESPTNAMVLNTLFTRMIAGAGDHTNCYFAERVPNMGSHASQMAKSVCLYSPWQFIFWYDRPEGSPAKIGGAGANQLYIREIPEIMFYDQLPTVWDDSKVIGGYPGEFGVVARRVKSTWFLGALNGEANRSFSIPFDFLEANTTYEMMLYEDIAQGDNTENVKITTIEVNSKYLLNRILKTQGGLAAIIKKL
jgi:alpha-glucosidase